ncbi:receptor-like protein kinase [Gossypium australe]|uniref:Receptor-like protein kinase n=1 Tax=Gossypium australe TaxID=47621 RepID=A0A5B6WS37_9ROSI|nr:receptor-like protein kinase [Gossypium australe]
MCFMCRCFDDTDRIHLMLLLLLRTIRILARETKELRNKRISLVKVLWHKHGVEEATWEPEYVMREQYPHLFTAPEDEKKGKRDQNGVNGPYHEIHTAWAQDYTAVPPVLLEHDRLLIHTTVPHSTGLNTAWPRLTRACAMAVSLSQERAISFGFGYLGAKKPISKAYINPLSIT